MHQPQEKADPENHDRDREEFARVADQHDVAKAGGRKSGHGELERIDIVHDLVVHPRLDLIDQRGHREDEDQKVQGSAQRGFVSTEDRDVLAELVESLRRIEDPEQPEHPQEGKPSPQIGTRSDMITRMSATPQKLRMSLSGLREIHRRARK